MEILQLTLEHMGKLHAYEHVLVYLLAFGPFALLALTIWISRRRQENDEPADQPVDRAGDPGERVHDPR